MTAMSAIKLGPDGPSNMLRPLSSQSRLPLTLRRKTISCCRSAAFSASSRLFDLNGEARTKQTSAIIAPS